MDSFKHFLSFIHQLLSSTKLFGAVLYEKGERRLLKTGDFLEMSVFAVKFKLSLLPNREEFVKKKENFLKKDLSYKSLSECLHRCHCLGDTSIYLHLIFQI
jgi:hypothetical protein